MLKPGAELRFMEHAAPTSRKARVQERFDRWGVWPRLVGGCHCARDTLSAIEAAGFAVEEAAASTSARPRALTNPHVIGIARHLSDVIDYPRGSDGSSGPTSTAASAADSSTTAANSKITVELDDRPKAGLLPTEQALAVAHDQACERDRGDRDARQRSDATRPPVGEAGDRGRAGNRVGEEQGADPAHLVEEGEVLLDVDDGLARERECARGPEDVSNA